MKCLKGLFSIIAVILFVVPGCSNNTITPSTSGASSATTAVASRLVFTGNADGVVVDISFFDDYLEKVLDGNPYNNSVSVPPVQSWYVLPFEIKITSFDYYFNYTRNAVDITCSKDVYNNKVDTYITGSLPNGHQALFAMSTDGFFYTCDTTLTPTCPTTSWVVQGPQDEITSINMVTNDPSNSANLYNPTYVCSGSDGNDYIVGLYGAYNVMTSNINDVFNIKTGIFTGVVSVKMKNYNNSPIYLFVE